MYHAFAPTFPMTYCGVATCAAEQQTSTEQRLESIQSMKRWFYVSWTLKKHRNISNNISRTSLHKFVTVTFKHKGVELVDSSNIQTYNVKYIVSPLWPRKQCSLQPCCVLEHFCTELQLSVCPPTPTKCIIFTYAQSCSESLLKMWETSAEVNQTGLKESGYMQIAPSQSSSWNTLNITDWR